MILMTDGWYGIRVELDEYLQNLLKEKKIYIGQKLYIQGAELCGSDQPVSPLEVCQQLHFILIGVSFNSTTLVNIVLLWLHPQNICNIFASMRLLHCE